MGKTMKNYTFSGNHPSMELVAELLNDLKKAETTLAAALARAEAAEKRVFELEAELANERERANNAEVRGVELEAALNNEKQMSSLRADLIAALNDEVGKLEAQLAANAGEWRPVSEAPEEDDIYLVWCDSYGGLEVQIFSTTENRWYATDYRMGNAPDYWRPVQPPQE